MAEITNTIIEFFQNLFNNNSILIIIFIALFPIIELRGAVPVAIKLGMEWYEALFFSWLGSSLVVPVLLLILMPILNAMKRSKWFKSLAHSVESGFKGKADKIQNKADAAESERRALMKKLIGVFAFVAVPLPLTGVWTGTAVAVFLGLKFWYALPVVLLGNLTAGIIMTILSVCFAEYVDTILAVFMILVLVIVAFYIIRLIVKMVQNRKKMAEETTLTDSTQVDSNSTDVAVDETEGEDGVDSIVDIENNASNEAPVVDDNVDDTDVHSIDEDSDSDSTTESKE